MTVISPGGFPGIHVLPTMGFAAPSGAHRGKDVLVFGAPRFPLHAADEEGTLGRRGDVARGDKGADRLAWRVGKSESHVRPIGAEADGALCASLAQIINIRGRPFSVA